MGDVVGGAGVDLITKHLVELKEKYQSDFVIINGENACGGLGLDEDSYQAFLNAGADAVTLGNHYRSYKGLDRFIDNSNIVRPLNLINPYPGVGSKVFTASNGVKVRVTNLLGKVLLKERVENPYNVIMNVINNDHENVIHIVDYHAEATSEKKSIAYLLKDKVTAVIGTHTHVQTNDAQLMDGIAYISDVGMCGLYNSSIGYPIKEVSERCFLNSDVRPVIPNEIDGYDGMINGVVIDVDEKSGRSRSIQKVNELYLDNENENY